MYFFLAIFIISALSRTQKKKQFPHANPIVVSYSRCNKFFVRISEVYRSDRHKRTSDSYSTPQKTCNVKTPFFVCLLL